MTKLIEIMVKLTVVACWMACAMMAYMCYLMVAGIAVAAKKPVPRFPRSWTRMPRMPHVF